MSRISFTYTYLQALSHKRGLEFDVTNEQPLHRLDHITFATITPKGVRVERCDEKVCYYRVDVLVNKSARVTMDMQKMVMKLVLQRVKEFAGASRIRSIVFSANPDNVRDFCIMLKFALNGKDVPPPDIVVQQHIRNCLGKMGCMEFPRDDTQFGESYTPSLVDDVEADWKYQL